jgi:UDP-N-acetyl-D-glucosamine/UDP-N-acetyl-D-galactosamine dehydrogenase
VSDLDGEAPRLFVARSEASEHPLKGTRVGIVGITFAEDVPDLRDSRLPDILAELRALKSAFVADLLADPDNAKRESSTG